METKAHTASSWRDTGDLYMGLSLRWSIIMRRLRIWFRKRLSKRITPLHHSIKKYSFSTWLFKIATNNCIDHLRKRKLQTSSIDAPIQTKDGSVTQELPDNSYNPEMDAIRNEMIESINQVIGSLPDKYREVIELRHKQDRSYEEIANELEIPIGTVKARIFRAREILKKSITKMKIR